jgi:hypothetical protein
MLGCTTEYAQPADGTCDKARQSLRGSRAENHKLNLGAARLHAGGETQQLQCITTVPPAETISRMSMARLKTHSLSRVYCSIPNAILYTQALV